MTKRSLIFLFLALICLTIAISSMMEKDHLIPRSIIFGPANKNLPKISPNAKYIAYLAPLNENSKVLNIWVKSVDKNDDHPVTNITNRSLYTFSWSEDSTRVLYFQDNDGDENSQLYGTKIDNKITENYTPFKDVKATVIAYNKFHPDIMLLGLNKDNKELHDVYKLKLSTKELTLIEKNPGKVKAWIADKDLNIRGIIVPKDDGSNELLIRKNNQDKWHLLRTFDYQDYACSGPVGFSYDGNTFYVFDSKNSNTSKLISIDLKTNKEKIISQDPEYDIHDVYINPDTSEIEGVSYVKEYETWHPITRRFQKLINRIGAIDHGNIHLISTDDSQKLWTVAIEKDTRSVSYYLYNIDTDQHQHLFDVRPKLNNYKLAEMKPIKYTARDGLTIHGYLTCPINKEQKNLPLILNVHGGPGVRDKWGYNPEIQWLANRGYAVLQVNYRGSTGYGKKFVNAGDREWGGKMHDDLVDAVNWAIEQKIADPKKIAIYGGSYGGYAALVGATFTPDLFCCAVDLFGVSNLLTFLNSIPPYWKLYINNLHKSVGNPATEIEFLKERSPLFKAKNIKIPLLIAQGAQDPRVKQEESEQIVAALKEHNIPHKYLLFRDEGHGLVKHENKQLFYKTAEEFLAEHLGGSCE